MKIAVVSKKPLQGAIKQVSSALEEFGATYELMKQPTYRDLENFELVLAVGGDRDVLEAFHAIGASRIPVLGVNDSDEEGFLTEVAVGGFREAFERVVRRDYTLEEAVRLCVKVDGRELPPALNEAAIFASKSATLVEYVLNVDGEVVWRDYGDGVIISTPTGSTAYSMSAGGPMVHRQSKVFVIVSVNSLDITRRPLIISDSARVRIGEITSSRGCDVVVDGILRVKVKEAVEVSKASEPARLIRLPETAKVMDKMAKKVRLAEDLLKMPPSAKLIMKTLEYEGPLTQKDLIRRTVLPDRTARLALSVLIQKGLVVKRPLLRDARQSVYYAA